MEQVTLDTPAGRLHVTAPPGYVLTGAEWSDDGVAARVLVDGAVDRCATCGTTKVRRYGRNDVGILDAPSGGVRARMVVARQRVECLQCNEMTREHLPHVSRGHRFTDRAGQWMTSQFGVRPNNAIAQVLGLAERTVRLYANEIGVGPGHRWRTVTGMAECASCLRLFPAGDLDVHHVSPRERSPPAPDVRVLCRDCHTDAAACWVNPG